MADTRLFTEILHNPRHILQALLTPYPHLRHYKSSTALLDMHHLTCGMTGINSLLHSINLVLFTLLLVHLILCVSPHRSHHLRSHHLSHPRPFTGDAENARHEIARQEKSAPNFNDGNARHENAGNAFLSSYP